MIKTVLLQAILWVCIIIPALAQPLVDQSKVSESLFEELSNDQEGFISVGIRLTDRVDARALDANFYKQNYTLKQRTYTLITQLKAKAAETQGPILDFLNLSNDVKEGSIYPFWIDNLIFVDAKSEVITQLSQRSDIAWIELNKGAQKAKITASPMSTKAIGGIEPGLAAINAPAMWNLGYTGHRRKALIIDTGTDPTHPALASRYWGNFVPDSQAWYDFNDNTPSPNDCDEHGTHVTGTVLGLDPITADTIGVALGAFWMASPAICNNTMADDVASLQFALDPDNDPNTIDDMPDVINNSWFNPFVSDSCSANSYTAAMDALEAAGVAVVFAGGNFGPGISTITPPQTYVADLVNSFTVGSLNGNFPSLPIAGFSSRGPTSCGGTAGPLNIRPEVSAPGVQVRSSTPGGNYAAFDGTSMAAPHVAGAILLLKEAFPTLTGTQLKLALYFSAIDLGQPGEDNIYGNGIIDVYAAYNYLIAEGNTPFLVPDINITPEKITNTNPCDSVFTGTVTIKNNGSANLTSLDLRYSLEAGVNNVHSWTGNLAPDQEIDIVLPIQTLANGSYNIEVEILTANGAPEYFDLDNTISLDFSIFGYREVSSTPVNACQNSLTMLLASSSNPDDVIRWFESPISSDPLGTGVSFVTPPLASITPFYIGLYTTAEVAKKDSSGSGFVFPTVNSSLIFDVKSPIILKSVVVYNNSASNHTIVVRDENNTLIDLETLFIDKGMQKLDLGFSIPAGDNFSIGLAGNNPGLFSNINGFSFPYDFNNIISITGSGNGLYHHFYDWEIEYELPCERTMTFASVTAGTITADFSMQNTTVDISQPQAAEFYDQSIGATEWNWSFGDGTTSTEQNPKHNYTESGVYTVALSVLGEDFCTVAVTKTIEAVGEYPYAVGIDDLDELGMITIYPNPSNGQFSLLAELENTQEVGLKVYNLMGAEVANLGLKTMRNEELTVDLSYLSEGIYYLSMEFEEKKIVKKIIITD